MNEIDLSATPSGCYRVYNCTTRQKINDYFNKVEALLEATRLRKQGINARVVFMYYFDLFKINYLFVSLLSISSRITSIHNFCLLIFVIFDI